MDKKIRDLVATRLKEYRVQAGITMAGAAQKIGKSPGSIAHYESGYREPPINVLAELADLYGVDLVTLVAREEEEEEIRRYLEALRALPAESREEILRYLEDRLLLAQVRGNQERQPREIP